MSNISGFVKRIRDIMRNDAGINGDAQRIEQIAWMLFLKVYDSKEEDWEFNEDNYQSIIPETCRWRNWAHDENGKGLTGDAFLAFVNNTLFPQLKSIEVTPQTPIKKAIVRTTFEDANNYMKDGVYLRQVIDVIDEIEFDDVKESHAFGFVYEEILRELQSAGSSGEFYTPRAVTEFMALMIKPQLGEKMADFACGTGGFITSWLGQLSKQVTDTSAQKQLDDSIYGIEKKPFPYLLCVTNMLLHDIEVPNIYHMNSLKHNLLDYTDADKFDVILMNPPYGGHEDKSIQGFFPDDLASSETADLFMSVILYRLKKNGRAAVVVPDGFLFGLDNAKVNIKKRLIGEFNLHTVIRLPNSVFSPYTSITTNLLFFDNTKPTTETWFYRVDIPSDRKHFSKTKPMELKHFDDCIAWWNNREVIPDGEYFKAQKFTADYLLNEQGCNIDLCGYPHEEEEILDPTDLIQRYQEERASLNATVDRAVQQISTSLNQATVLPDIDYASGALTRLAELDAHFADKMIKSVLEIAIKGKLVPQYPTEGTARDLLEKNLIDVEIDGRRVKQKVITEISEDEKTFDIPDSWEWIKLGNVCTIARGGSPRPIKEYITTAADGVNWIKIGDTEKNGKYICATAEKIKPSGVSKSRMVHAGDFLLTNSMSFGRPYILKVDGCIHDGWLVISQSTEIFDQDYLYWLLSSNYAYMQFCGKVSGAVVKNLNSDKVANSVFPLPPLAEQKRIVAKLEEILPLCERLK